MVEIFKNNKSQEEKQALVSLLSEKLRTIARWGFENKYCSAGVNLMWGGHTTGFPLKNDVIQLTAREKMLSHRSFSYFSHFEDTGERIPSDLMPHIKSYIKSIFLENGYSLPFNLRLEDYDNVYINIYPEDSQGAFPHQDHSEDASVTHYPIISLSFGLSQNFFIIERNSLNEFAKPLQFQIIPEETVVDYFQQCTTKFINSNEEEKKEMNFIPSSYYVEDGDLLIFGGHERFSPHATTPTSKMNEESWNDLGYSELTLPPKSGTNENFIMQKFRLNLTVRRAREMEF